MADTKREIERKYAAEPGATPPDLTGAAGVAETRDRGAVELDAVYYDTADLRLAAAAITLRRRTGDDEAGWHLKLPVGDGVRDEIHAPLADTVPDALAGLVRARVREAELHPVVRILSSRRVQDLLDAEGAAVAELSVDDVLATRLHPATAGDAEGSETGSVAWTEIEVELADGVEPRLIDKLDKKLRKAGLREAAAPSKLARALAETGGGPAGRPEVRPGAGTAGAHVLDYLRAQRDAILTQDPAVRQDLPDSVHQMRVATRRARSAFTSARRFLDRQVTDPIGEELKWLAGELGVDRDLEVLTERLRHALDRTDETLVLGPASARLTAWSAAGGTDARARTLAALDSPRYLDLLDALDALLTDPPLLPRAGKPAAKQLPAAVCKDFDRLAARVDHALALPPGPERDIALHDARKAAKRLRYAAEAARPALGTPAQRFAKAVKRVQKLLGEHQDSIVAREALRTIAVQAHAAGESAFVWGLLYGQEHESAADQERALPAVWAQATDPGLREALQG